jgi:hypothetical protein
MTFSTYLSPGVALQGGGTSSGGGGAATAPLTGTGATITTSQPLIDVSQTWNNSGTTFTGAKINVTNTASAAASLLLDLQVGGSSKFNISYEGGAFALQEYRAGGTRNSPNSVLSNQLYLKTSSTDPGIYWSATAGTGAALLQVGYEANNVFAQRNGTAAQTFNLYGTYTDGSNYNRLSLKYDGTRYALVTTGPGTGGGGAEIDITQDTTVAMRIAATAVYFGGSLFFLNNNLRDIGIAGGLPRYIRAGSALVAPSLTVATLPAAATAGAGAHAFVTDADRTMAASIGTAVVAGGSNKVPVYSDGSIWLVG